MFYIRGSKFLILTISTLKHTTNTSQEPLTDQSVGQVEAGQGEREADEVQTEQENHCLLFSLQLTEDKFLQPLYI